MSQNSHFPTTMAIVKIVSNIRFLGRRDIPLRGDVGGNHSNITQIFHLPTENNPAHSTWLVTMQMQNEMLKVMALEVLRDVAPSLHSTRSTP